MKRTSFEIKMNGEKVATISGEAPSNEILAEAMVIYAELTKKYSAGQVIRVANLISTMARIDDNPF